MKDRKPLPVVRTLFKSWQALRKTGQSLLGNLQGKAPIYVYQMGKVGSQSIFYSLQECGYQPLFHFHTIDQLRQKQRFDYALVAARLRARRPIRVITLVREPVSRNLSAFAHDFKGFFGSVMQDHSVKELEDRFLTHYDRHQYGVEWFDREFFPVIGVDVYAHPFDQQVGWGFISQDNFQILLLKLELDDAVIEQAVQQFLDDREFRLKRYNLASKKAGYKGNYRQFVDAIQLPKEYVDSQYEHKFFRHFYSSSERQQFERQWLKMQGQAEEGS